MRSKRINTFTKTVATEHGEFSDAFVPGWDQKVGYEQPMSRIAVRRAQGQKMTPKGRGTLRPSR